jgi:diguanylate cyclase (GGDEF)-like protein/PAS domain S-box-containing protein
VASLDITERKEAEEAYTLLVDNSLQALIIFQDGRNVFANPAAAHITGYTQEELLAMSPEEANQVIYPDDRMLLAERARKRQQGEDVPPRYEFRLIRKDGAVRWVECFNVRMLYRRKPAVQMTYIDITERKEAEEAYTLLVEHSLQALQIFQDGRIVFTNAAATRITGYSQEDFLALSPDAWPLYIHPDDREAIVQRSRDRLAGKAVPSRYAYRFIRKDGAVRWIEQMVTSIIYRGRPATYMTYIDITERKQAEEALREREQFIQQVANTTPGIIYVYDVIQQQNIYSNHQITTLLGYSVEEVQAMGAAFMATLLHPDDREPYRHHLATQAQSWDNDLLTIEYRARNRDGTWRWLISHETVFARTATGQVQQILGVAYDITERKQAEEALRASEERYRLLFESSLDGIVITNNAGQYQAANPAAYALLGYQQAELLTMSVGELLVPDGSASAQWQYEDYVSRGAQHGEFAFQRPDGEVRIVEFSAHQSGADIHMSILRDITERKQAEEALRASEQRLQAIFDNAAVGIGLTDKTGRSILANARGAHQLGYTPEELAQLSNLELTHPDDRAQTVERMQQLVRGESQGYRIERRYLRKDGSIFWADLSVSAIYDDDGQITHFLGVVVDITERKQLEHQLHQANMLLQEQAIRDPLTGLHNRRYLDETLPRELQRAERQGQPVGIIMLDIDHFKRFNDTYGHDAGDTVLRAVGAFLQQHTRGADIACRYGGEEFTLVLPGASLADARQRAEELRTRVQTLVVQHGGQALEKVTASLGVAIFRTHGTTADALVSTADQALYQAKRNGRNRVEVVTIPHSEA